MLHKVLTNTFLPALNPHACLIMVSIFDFELLLKWSMKSVTEFSKSLKTVLLKCKNSES